MSGYKLPPGAMQVVTEIPPPNHPIHVNYPLLPGDVLTRDENCTWAKHNGLGITGFRLTPEQEATLEPVSGYMEFL